MQRVEDNEEIIERVAAIDVGKAEQSVGDKAPSRGSLVVCGHHL